MTIKIYASYGVLAHEKRPVYTESAPISDIYDALTVELPNDITTYVGAWGDRIFEVCEKRYLASEILTNWGDEPALVWSDGKTQHHRVLKVVEDEEEKR